VTLSVGLFYANAQRLHAERALAVAEAAEQSKELARARAVEAGELAIAEADRARREARKAERVTRFLQSMLANAAPTEASDRELTVAEFAKSAIAGARDELAGEPEVLAAVQTTMARMLAGLGRYDEAETQVEQALAYQLPALG